MMAARALLGLLGLLLVAVGLLFLVDPRGSSSAVGIALTSELAISDVRAVYGGLDLALGLVVAGSALRSRFVLAGLIAASVVYGGLTLGRLVHILAGSYNPDIGVLLAIELSGFVLALLALRHTRSSLFIICTA